MSNWTSDARATDSASRVQVLGVLVDPLSMDEAAARIGVWLEAPDPECKYVVTPNLDHAVLLREHAPLRQAYQEASLILPDGMPMVWAGRLLGAPIKERVAGSDLVPQLMERANASRPLRVFLLGAAPGVGARAAHAIHKRFPGTVVVGTHSPDVGFEKDEAANSAIIEAVNATKPHLLVVGFGAPKQELWIHRHAARLRCQVAVCAGATIDFLAGHRRRAPRWMQLSGTEWVFRALSEPSRLVPRYAKDARHLPSLLYDDWKASRGTPQKRY